MQNKLPFIDILAPEPGSPRREDPAGFEYTLPAEITSIYPLTATEKLYQIRISDPGQRDRFFFRPGQFVMLELPGIGEAPFSISSSPVRRGDLELCIRAVGNLTNFLARVERGTKVGISGPFGTSFPLEKMQGQDILLIAGGLGIVPLRSPLLAVLESRSNYGRVDIMYGAKSPSELLFTYQYEEWRRFDINLGITVDQAEADWPGRTGLITELLQERLKQTVNLRDVTDHGANPQRSNNHGTSGHRVPQVAASGTAMRTLVREPDRSPQDVVPCDRLLRENTYAIVCGPPVMFHFVCKMLTEAGLPMQKMFVSLERRMHCGRGKCCRCNIGSTYTCLDGPIFDYWSVLNLKEAI